MRAIAVQAVQAWQAPRRRLGQISLAWGLLCAAGIALAQGSAGGAVPAPPPTDASPWLHRIQQAAANSSYQGTLMFSAGGVVSSSRVLHICDGRQRYERIEVLDGRARLQFRHNEQVLTLWPASKLARAEQHEAATEFPALPAAVGQRALENYEALTLARDRIAGREADVLTLKPKDKLRYAQRLWADRDTGLLLRNDVLAPGGEVLESSAFSDVQIGGKPSPEAVPALLLAMKKLDGYRVLRSVSERTQIEAEGWSLQRAVPGFQLVSCSKRPLDNGSDGGAPVQVLQSVFSDGLTQVSVFIEPFDLQRHKQPMGTSLGATHTLTNRQGDWWITVVGEVPMATAQQFWAMFERRR